jgi:photosystem II stability/assembly factor-like uncharacterized protein
MKTTKRSTKFFIALLICLVLSFGGQWAFAQADFWEQTHGPYGGFITELAIDSSNGHIFAGICRGGIFRSTDNGDIWTAVNTGLTNLYVGSLAINPATRDIFAGTYDGGVFRSTNNGDSWTAVNTGLTNLYVGPLAINSSGHIFAGTIYGGVFRSTNNGDNWTAAGLMNLGVGSLAINAATGDIFAGTPATCSGDFGQPPG